MTDPHARPAPDSFDPAAIAEGSLGQRAHRDLIDHSRRLERRLYRVGDHVWTLVGNGLSNQTFVRGPDGLIAIDSGECVEEMASALVELRAVCDLPVVACIYTHFHYVGGTRALLAETGGRELEIYGHRAIEDNLRRYAGDLAPRITRGIVHQFGLLLPAQGPDALVNVGLGRFFRNPGHAPFTPGHLPAGRVFDAPLEARIAGLDVHLTPAPSDSDDSITIAFPELDVVVNNLVWPALYNVFAIRGESYRDPRVLLTGLDHLLGLAPEHLVATHGAPLSGRSAVRDVITDYRDAIQFMWDQTVRGVNRGRSLGELIAEIRLPERFRRTHFTRQFYGLLEHHVRQIHAGLLGWFDEDAANLFPLPAAQRARRLIDGFGGTDAVRARVDEALTCDDHRWAIELASWLVQDGDQADDRRRLAAGLRGVGHATTSANVRNWCLTRALELEGSIDLGRFRGHRFRAEELLSAPPESFVPVLRVLLDPARAHGIRGELRFDFDDAGSAGLELRDGVAVPVGGETAETVLSLDRQSWARLLGGRSTLAEELDAGHVRVTGSREVAERLLSVFDVPGFFQPRA